MGLCDECGKPIRSLTHANRHETSREPVWHGMLGSLSPADPILPILLERALDECDELRARRLRAPGNHCLALGSLE